MDTSDQEQEIASLKATYGGQVKVIKGIGDFTNVVTMTPKDTGLQIKFQLAAAYPATAAVISIRSTALTPEQVDTLTAILQTETNRLAGKPAIRAVIPACHTWAAENDVDITDKAISAQPKKGEGKRKPIKKTTDKSSNVEPVDQFVKKAPMKTASSVIKRIQWDKAVDKEAFIVGYLDRLTRLEESDFRDFVWEDFATVDHYALAIPQHRIQYFKYKDEKVWDKNERLDNVFGSTGSNITIVEAIDAYETKHEQSAACGNDVDAAGTEADNTQPDTHVVDGDGNGGPANTAVFDLDDAVSNLHLRQTNTSKKSSRRHDRYDNPNFFIALRITDDECISNFQAIQKVLCRQFPQYQYYNIPRNGFHITLSVLRLEAVTDVARCITALKAIRPKIVEMCKSTEPLVFQGLGCFSSKVIYADVKDCPRLRLLVDTIETHLMHSNVHVIIQQRRFTPHMTLFKVSWSRTRQPDWPRMLPILTPFAETHIGKQAVNNVQLCEMGTLTETGEFYSSPLVIDI